MYARNQNVIYVKFIKTEKTDQSPKYQVYIHVKGEGQFAQYWSILGVIDFSQFPSLNLD